MIPTSRVRSHRADGIARETSQEKDPKKSLRGKVRGKVEAHAGDPRTSIANGHQPPGVHDLPWNRLPTPSARWPSSWASRGPRPTTSSPRAPCRWFRWPVGASSCRGLPSSDLSARRYRASCTPDTNTLTATPAGARTTMTPQRTAVGDRLLANSAIATSGRPRSVPDHDQRGCGGQRGYRRSCADRSWTDPGADWGRE